MRRIASWWRALSLRGKVITVVAVLVVFGVASAAGARNDEDGSVARASQTAEQSTPSERATEAATPEPTEKPTPTASVEPTPIPTATPVPTPIPTATPVPTPIPTPTPAFADIELSGVGDSVPRFELPADTPAIAEVTHTGGSNFAIFTIAEDGSQSDLLVNTIGAYDGTVLFDESGQHSVAFEITAGGAWTITIKPLTAAFLWDASEEVSGTGDDVVRIDPPIAGLVSADVTHSGASNFAIFGYSSGFPDLLVNEIGNYAGEVLIGSGTFFLEITADGAWTISPS